jgi:hypothetical protein
MKKSSKAVLTGKLSHLKSYTLSFKNYFLVVSAAALVVSTAAAVVSTGAVTESVFTVSAAGVWFSPELQAAKAPRANTNNSFFMFVCFVVSEFNINTRM